MLTVDKTKSYIKTTILANYLYPKHEVKLVLSMGDNFSLADYNIITQEIHLHINLINAILGLNKKPVDVDVFIAHVISHEFLHYIIHKEIGLLESNTFDNKYGFLDLNNVNLGAGL